MDGHSHPYGGSGEGSGMVDIQPSTMERPLMDSNATGDGHLHGCLRRGMGDRDRFPDLERSMDTGGAQDAHQLERDTDGIPRGHPSPSSRTDGERHHRQHEHHLVYQQVRRHEVTSIDGSSRQSVETLSSYRHTTADHIRAISLQPSGLAIQKVATTAGVEPGPTVFPGTGPLVGASPRRSIRIADQHATPSLLLLATSPMGNGNRRTPTQLERTGQLIPLPTMELNPTSSTATQTGEVGGDPDRPLLAVSCMVSVGTGDVHQSADPDPKVIAYFLLQEAQVMSSRRTPIGT